MNPTTPQTAGTPTPAGKPARPTLYPTGFKHADSRAAPVDEDGRRSAWLASNLTMRQFFYWLEESTTPDLPLSQNIYHHTLPTHLAPHLEAAWMLFHNAADGCRARLQIEAGVPRLDFSCAPEPLAVLELDEPRPANDADHTEAVFACVDPWWTSFRPGESLVRHLLVRWADGHCDWILTAGHLVADGRAFELMLITMVDLMEALAEGRRPAPPVLPSFEANMQRDRAEELAADRFSNRLDWHTVIGGDVPPFRTYGIDERTGTVCRVRATPILGPDALKALFETVQRPGLFHRSIEASAANFFTALMALWIWRHGGQRKTLFGVPFHGRRADEFMVFGFKSEILPLMVEIDPEMTFAELVAQVHEGAALALRHRGQSIANPLHRPVIHAYPNFIFDRNQKTGFNPGLKRLMIPRRSAAPVSVNFLQFNHPQHPESMLILLGVHSRTGEYTDESRLGTGYTRALTALIDNPLLKLRDVPFNDPH